MQRLHMRMEHLRFRLLAPGFARIHGSRRDPTCAELRQLIRREIAKAYAHPDVGCRAHNFGFGMEENSVQGESDFDDRMLGKGIAGVNEGAAGAEVADLVQAEMSR